MIHLFVFLCQTERRVLKLRWTDNHIILVAQRMQILISHFAHIFGFSPRLLCHIHRHIHLCLHVVSHPSYSAIVGHCGRHALYVHAICHAPDLRVGCYRRHHKSHGGRLLQVRSIADRHLLPAHLQIHRHVQLHIIQIRYRTRSRIYQSYLHLLLARGFGCYGDLHRIHTRLDVEIRYGDGIIISRGKFASQRHGHLRFFRSTHCHLGKASHVLVLPYVLGIKRDRQRVVVRHD